MKPDLRPQNGLRGLARAGSCASPLVESLERRRLLDGLTGQYFNGSDQTNLVTTRLDPTLDFTWPGSPAAGVNADHFSARWTGQVEAPTSEVYTFTTTADDGVRLWVDGRLLVDNYVNQGSTDRSGSVALEAGKRYDIRIDYYDYDLSARLRLAWSTPTMASQTVPSTRLFSNAAGLSATYFNNIDFTAPGLRRTDPNANFNWPTGTPDAPTIAADGFSARWTGYIVPTFNETYTFGLIVDAGKTARLRVDGKLLVDTGSVQDDGRVALEAGVRYPISIEYVSTSGAAGIGLTWSSPSVPYQAVPADRFITGVATAIPSRRVSYTNPVINADQPDPGIIRTDGAYWMVHTTGGPAGGWPLWKSLDGVNWVYQKDLLSSANKQSWMNGNYWAPEIHKVGSGFVLTGVSTDSRTGRLTIVMASSARIDGTYVVRSEPLVSDSSRSVLDPNIFQDDDGKQYLLWKRDGPDGGTHGSIRIRQLDATGLNFATNSVENTILDNETGGWEQFLAEAPELIRRGDAYYLFYSGAFIDTTYKLGVARSTSLSAMFTRNPSNPIIGNNSVWGGPGHGGFTIDNDGALWHLYHARRISNPDAGRLQVLDPVVWTASGWPSFANNSVSTTSLPGPHVDALTGAGILTLNGDAVANAADSFRLVRSTSDASILELYTNNVLIKSMPFAEVQQVIISGGGGNDTLTLDCSRGDVIPGAGISFDGGVGTLDTVRVVAASAGDVYRYLGAGKIAFGSGLVTTSGVEKLAMAGGDNHVQGDLTGVGIDLQSGKLTFDTNARMGALNLSAFTLASLATGDHTLTVSSLVIAATGRFDLADGALVIDYDATAGSPLSTVEGYVKTGRAGGTWSAVSGIFSSTAAAHIADGATVGIAEASTALPTTPAVFANVAVDSTAVLLRYSLVADANLDRSVDFSDLLILSQNYGTTGKSYGQGNFDYSDDGSVGFDDLLLLAQRYDTSLALVAAAPITQKSTPATKRRAASDVLTS